MLSNWIVEKTKEDTQCVERDIRPLLSAFFSSPWAFKDEVRKAEIRGVHLDRELLNNAERWLNFEKNILAQLRNISYLFHFHFFEKEMKLLNNILF